MNFLLLHGSWHGAWCWYKIAPRLRAAGHSVIVPDLPGRGRSPAAPALVGSRQMLRQLERALPTDQKTVVVAHSRYGVLASQLSEMAPERIARCVYLASFMLPGGKSVASYFSSDTDSQIGPFVQVNRLGVWDRLQPEAYRQVLYHDCSEDDNALAASLLCREPLRPAISRLKLSDERYGRIPRAYIRLTEDRAVSPALQDRLIAETGADRVESLRAGHSAYFSKPDELAATILSVAR